MYILKPNHNIGLSNICYNWASPACPMTYNANEVDAKGGAFSMHFINQTSPPSNQGNGYKGYPCGVIGGYKKGGVYSPGVVAACGMPQKIVDLNHDVRIKWQVSQSNVGNEGGITDKWFASLNVIFDNVVSGTTEPIESARDYDLVIELNRFEQENLSDKSKLGNTVYWKFARNGNSTSPLKTFDLHYGAEIYKYAVRFKFFNYPVGDPNEDKNDKVHVKFICVDNAHVPPYIDHSLKLFINTSKNYLPHANLDSTETVLANAKVGLDNIWVKSLSAGYEIYEGDFIIRNDYFYTVIDNAPPPIPVNLTAIKNPTTINLNWDDVTEPSLEGYDVFRSSNGGSFQIIGRAYTSDYVDNGIVSTNSYAYYVKAIDRSFNTSAASNTAYDVQKISLSAKILLQGAYNTTSGVMDNYLGTSNLLPSAQPYGNFTHLGSGGETATSTVLTANNGNNSIVDWIFLELRNKNNAATRLYTRVGLLQKDGDIVDMDGTSPISFSGAAADNYYIAVRHRNHLGFRTLNAVSLSHTPVNLNFSNNSIALFGSTPTTLAAPAIYAMISGDSNSDGSVDAFDTILWESSNGLFDDYLNIADYNMDGSVDAFDSILWELSNGKFEELD